MENITPKTPEMKHFYDKEELPRAPVRKLISSEKDIVHSGNTESLESDFEYSNFLQGPSIRKSPMSERKNKKHRNIPYYSQEQVSSDSEEEGYVIGEVLSPKTKTGVKRDFPRYYDIEPETQKVKKSKDRSEGKNNLYTPKSVGRGEVRFVENCPEFWTSGNVFSVNDNLLVKRHNSMLQDFIHIAKISATSTQKFKFPTSGLDLLIPRLQSILDDIDHDENGDLYYPGLEEETPYQEFASEEFWNSNLCVKFMKFKIRLYKTDYGRLAFRLLNEVPEKSKVLKFNTVVWNGPTTSISFESFKGLLDVFKKIHSQRSIKKK